MSEPEHGVDPSTPLSNRGAVEHDRLARAASSVAPLARVEGGRNGISRGISADRSVPLPPRPIPGASETSDGQWPPSGNHTNVAECRVGLWVGPAAPIA